MKFYIDGCDINQIQELSDVGIIDGITTNPSLAKDAGIPVIELAKQICEIIKTSVSVEVIATDYETIMKEAAVLSKLGPQIVIKLPMTWDGLKACKSLTSDGIKTNVTLCFSPAQALAAAKAGATYVSPFVGRIDDIGGYGMGLVSEIREIFDNYQEINTKILAASIRNVNHIIDAAKVGADVATAPYGVIKQMLNHPLTDKGLERFLKDAETAGYKIL